MAKVYITANDFYLFLRAFTALFITIYFEIKVKVHLSQPGPMFRWEKWTSTLISKLIVKNKAFNDFKKDRNH